MQNLDLRHVPSKLRNPIIADVFGRLKLMERRGSGFRKILDSYEEQYEGAADYYGTNFWFLIIGVIIVIFFSTFALVAFNIVHKQDKEDRKDLAEVIGDELGEGTEKLKSDADPDIENNTDDNEIERLRVQNEIENANNNENENNN